MSRSRMRHCGNNLVDVSSLSFGPMFQASLRMHAMRAYLSVTSEYDKEEWVHINDHICSSIGRQSAHLGQYLNALPWFTKLLESTRQPASMQKGYLQVKSKRICRRYFREP